jgi:hypothetical protein
VKSAWYLMHDEQDTGEGLSRADNLEFRSLALLLKARFLVVLRGKARLFMVSRQCLKGLGGKLMQEQAWWAKKGRVRAFVGASSAIFFLSAALMGYPVDDCGDLSMDVAAEVEWTQLVRRAALQDRIGWFVRSDYFFDFVSVLTLTYKSAQFHLESGHQRFVTRPEY